MYSFSLALPATLDFQHMHRIWVFQVISAALLPTLRDNTGVLSTADAVAPLVLNWEHVAAGRGEMPPQCDVVLGADLLYNEKMLGPLVGTLKALATRSPGCLFIIAHQERTATLDAAFRSQLEAMALDLVVEHAAVDTTRCILLSGHLSPRPQERQFAI
eukprot:m.48417 g.48417  ORF g.48417 m.48417 type:complete len:159 (-) comp11996_c0_seq2:111-587(-)